MEIMALDPSDRFHRQEYSPKEVRIAVRTAETLAKNMLDEMTDI